MKNRKFAASVFALGVAAAVGLTGCANSGSGSSGSGDAETIDFPTKDIRLVVPWNPGGDGDLTARTIAPLMEDELGVNIIVENRPGANGSIGYEWLLDQNPDGYNMSMFGPEVGTLRFQGYDILPENYTFVGQGTGAAGGLAVPKDSPYETLDDLIAAAKASPNTLTYATPGTGSGWDLVTTDLMEKSGTELTNVPFDGAGPAAQAAAAGHVDFVVNTIGGMVGEQVKGGNMRFLAVLTDERDERHPDVPTARELGYDVVGSTFVGIMVSKDVPEEIVQILSDAMTKATKDPSYVKTIENAGINAVNRPFPEMGTYIAEYSDSVEPLFARINGAD